MDKTYRINISKKTSGISLFDGKKNLFRIRLSDKEEALVETIYQLLYTFIPELAPDYWVRLQDTGVIYEDDKPVGFEYAYTLEYGDSQYWFFASEYNDKDGTQRETIEKFILFLNETLPNIRFKITKR